MVLGVVSKLDRSIILYGIKYGPWYQPILAHTATTHHSFRGSFSAVSKPIFATKYAFFSIFRDLQDGLAKFSQKLQNFGEFRKILQNFTKFCKFLQIFKNVDKKCKFLQNFCRILQNVLVHFVDLEKCLKNAYLVAKIGFDTAENRSLK